MKKISINENAYPYPMPMVVLGTLVEDRPNFMAVGWVARVNFQPPMIAVALGKGHYTNGGIHASGVFSINIPSEEQLVPMDYAGIVSGSNADKSDVFESFYGNAGNIPMIRDCPVTMECKVIKIFDVGDKNEMIIAQVLETYADDAVLMDGKIDVEKVRPVIFNFPEYRSLGTTIGMGWKSGKEYSRS